MRVEQVFRYTTANFTHQGYECKAHRQKQEELNRMGDALQLGGSKKQFRMQLYYKTFF